MVFDESTQKILFGGLEDIWFPADLKAVILADPGIKELLFTSHQIAVRVWKRVEELRELNGLSYNTDNTPKWVKDHKFSIPYLKEDTADSVSETSSTNQSLKPSHQ